MLCCFLLTALKFSKFYSVALDGILTRDDKTAIEEILKYSSTLNWVDCKLSNIFMASETRVRGTAKLLRA